MGATWLKNYIHEIAERYIYRGGIGTYAGSISLNFENDLLVRPSLGLRFPAPRRDESDMGTAPTGELEVLETYPGRSGCSAGYGSNAQGLPERQPILRLGRLAWLQLFAHSWGWHQRAIDSTSPDTIFRSAVGQAPCKIPDGTG